MNEEMEKKEEACKLIEENLTETLEQFTAKKRRFNDEVVSQHGISLNFSGL